MQSTIIFAALIGSCLCVPYGMVNTGHSAQFREDDGHGSYEFGYNEDHATGGTFRKEKGGPGYQVGSYGLRDADGRMRIVHYIADAHGFRATISTNEPGVDVKQDPAATSLSSVHAAPIEHTPAAYAEPLHSAPIAHAPTGYAEPLHSAPIHSDPLYGQASYPIQSTLVGKSAYDSYDAYSPALSGSLMANAYEASIHKSAYVPEDYSAAEYAPILSNGNYGVRTALYGKQYPGFY